MTDDDGKDVYHCPECGYEWRGYGRSPPYPHCPNQNCDNGMMQEGPYDVAGESDDTDGYRDENERPFADERNARMRLPEDIMREGASTYAEKNADYGASWYAIGEVLYQMAGESEVVLSDPKDFVRIGLYTRRLDKLFRSFNGDFRADELTFESTEDSHADESVYAAMAAAVERMERYERDQMGDDDADGRDYDQAGWDR